MRGDRRLALWVIGVVVAFIAAAGAWAVATPPGSAPDDAFHLATIYCAWGDSSYCVHQPDEVLVTQRIAETYCYISKPFDSAACLYGLGDTLETGRVDNGSYPPVFHSVMRALAGDNVERSIVVMRLANVLLAGLLLGATLLLTGRAVRSAAAMAWLVGLVPVGMFFIASINPTSWAITGVGLFWAALIAWFRGGGGRIRRWLVAALVLLTAFIACGARTDSAPFLVATIIGVVLLAWPAVRRAPRRLWLLVPLVPLFAWSMSFQVTDVLTRGLRGDVTVEGDLPAGIPAAGIGNNLREVLTYIAGVFGIDRSAFDFGPTGYAWGLGPLDTPLPSLVGIIAIAAAGFVLVWGLRSYSPRKIIAVVLMSATIVAYPLLILSRTPTGTPGSLQPRYVLPMVIATLGVASVVAVRRSGRLRLAQGVLLTIALTLASAVALAVTMRRFTNGLYVSWTDLLVEPSWWWGWGPSPITVWLVGTIGAAAYFTLLVTVARRQDSPMPSAKADASASRHGRIDGTPSAAHRS